MAMDERIATCACGMVKVKTLGRPILSAVCYCNDCQAGGRQIEALPHAALIRDEWGGTPYLILRNDRLRCLEGAQLLQGFKLTERDPTTRFVATCCNSGMYLKYGP